MRADDNGKLTSADRTKLNNQQKLSNNIYQDKHNAATAHYGNNVVGQRRGTSKTALPTAFATAN